MKGILIFILLSISSSVLRAQSDSCGIYVKALDFSKHKLSYAGDCKSGNCPSVAGSLFNSEEVKVLVNGKKRKFKKSTFFGYRNCEKKVYRFYKNNEYQILNSHKIWMYDKPQESGTGMSPDIDIFYYFSVAQESQILPLTIDNLKEAFPDNIKFHDLLDSSFKGETALSDYDKYLQKYSLVHVFEESMKKE